MRKPDHASLYKAFKACHHFFFEHFGYLIPRLMRNRENIRGEGIITGNETDREIFYQSITIKV